MRSDTPLVDVRGLFERKSPDGIPGDNLLVDHVHPTIGGHQLVAEALLEAMMALGYVQPQPNWQTRRQDAYAQHLATLDALYYARGKERLEGLRKWTQGRAREFAQPPSPR
jgi:phospholipase/lecithinase/hemolysin